MWAVLVVLTEASVDSDIEDSWCQQTPMDYCRLRPVSRGKTAVSTLPRPSFPCSLNVCVFTFKINKCICSF